MTEFLQQILAGLSARLVYGVLALALSVTAAPACAADDTGPPGAALTSSGADKGRGSSGRGGGSSRSCGSSRSFRSTWRTTRSG